MTILNAVLENLLDDVMRGGRGLDEALVALEEWIADHIDEIGSSERRHFSASLEQKSTNDNRSLIDSVLKLQAARLLHHHDAQSTAKTLPETPPSPSSYQDAREAFVQALRRSEEATYEMQIDIAIANAHHLLGDTSANRRWLDKALARLPHLATVDLVALAENVPTLAPPQLNRLKRLALRLAGVNLERLAQRNRDSLMAVGTNQGNQIAILAHLLGTAFEAIGERQRAKRAFQIVALLVMRQHGLPGEDAGQLHDIANSIQRYEPDAAVLLHEQIRLLASPLPTEETR